VCVVDRDGRHICDTQAYTQQAYTHLCVSQAYTHLCVSQAYTHLCDTSVCD